MTYPNDPNLSRRNRAGDTSNYTGWLIGGLVALAVIVAVFAFSRSGEETSTASSTSSGTSTSAPATTGSGSSGGSTGSSTSAPEGGSTNR